MNNVLSGVDRPNIVEERIREHEKKMSIETSKLQVEPPTRTSTKQKIIEQAI